MATLSGPEHDEQKEDRIGCLVILLMMMALALNATCQHPHDTAQSAYDMGELNNCKYYYVNNHTAVDEIDATNLIREIGAGMNHELGSGGDDIWVTFPKAEMATVLQVDIYRPAGAAMSGILGSDPYPAGWCTVDPTLDLSYGLFQGWVWNMWWNPVFDGAPEFAWPVWGTNNMWMTDEYPGIILAYDGVGYDEAGWDINDPVIYPDLQPINNISLYYDPTRQGYKIRFDDAPAGQYYGQITTRGNCHGEAWLRVCEGYNVLSIDPGQTVLPPTENISTLESTKIKWNILGQEYIERY